MYLLLVLSVVTAAYAAICPTNINGMNDNIRQKFLDVHNELRALVASGKAKDGLGGYAPQAAAMPMLTYDCQIEKYAIVHAAKCQFKYSNVLYRPNAGENIYMRSPPYDKVKAAEDAPRTWFKELQRGVGANLTLTLALFDRGVGNYTQMVWQSTTAIGCAVQNCPGMSFVVCNYSPSGNKAYDKIYEAGTPCSKCPGACSNNLCVNAATTNAQTTKSTMPPTTTKGTPVETSTVPATGFAKQNSHLCSSSSGMTDDVREAFLNTHNELRALVAAGKAKDKLGGYAPQAAGMPKLTYDCEVEQYAVAHAAKCQFKHSDSISRRNTGENIYARSPPKAKAKTAEDASRAWFNELEKYGVGNDLTVSTALLNRGVGHYTQMVWQNTKAIGCAVADCGSMSFVVCNYKEAGNMRNAKIYEIGEPCTKCPNSCSNYLCVTGSIVPATNNSQTTKTTAKTTTTKPKATTTTTTKPTTTTTTRTTTTKPTMPPTTTKGTPVKTSTVPATGFAKQNSHLCSSSSGMTDDVRETFLNTHNELRALVAAGKAKDGLGGFAPQAAGMPKLTYDCEVEQYAVAHAAKCQFKHSDKTSRKSTGENIYMRSPPYGKTKAAEDASRAWFKELEEYGVGNNLTLDTALFNRGVGHYTQMVWQNTKAIGCAVADCSSMSFVVCNYKEAGNMLYSKIYEIGEPCTKCPNSCSNYLCVTGSIVPATNNPQTTKTTAKTMTTKPKATTTTTKATTTTTTKPTTTTTTTTTTTITTTTTTTTKPTGTTSTTTTTGGFEKQNPNLCPSDNGMTDVLRQKFLDTHNKLRSLAASGKAPDGAGGYAPQAAGMLKLLEKYASNHAKSCVWGHSKPETRNSAGENLYMRSPPYKSTASEQSKAAQKGVEAWFTELSAYGVGQNLRLTMDMMNRGVGHYTQVVWQNTKRVGCAIKDCASYSYVVCNYGDSGNWINQDIYEKGTPCTRCPENSTCSDSLCVL